MFSSTLRTYRDGDAAAVNELALAAFVQFRSQYSDWPAMAPAIGQMSALADTGEIIVAERDEQISGAVAYIPAERPKAAYFDQSWPIIRMLVVDTASRGTGVGRALSWSVRSLGRASTTTPLTGHGSLRSDTVPALVSRSNLWTSSRSRSVMPILS